MLIDQFNTHERVLIIAEIGNNHEGSVALAEEMIGLAARAGADAVKFQTIVPERLVAPSQPERLAQLRKMCLTYEDFEKLAAVARAEGVMFLSTPFDVQSATFLAALVPAIKIASGDNDFFPLLDVAASFGRPILLSSGLSDLAQVRVAKEFIERAWMRQSITAELAVMHCVVTYPTRPRDANLLALRELAQLGVTVGYSDHTCGIDAAVLSVALGARIIEKHFTLAKDYSRFRDHQLSADPADMAELVRRVREAEELIGSGGKRVLDCEIPLRESVRRSIVAARDLGQGQTVSWSDLEWLRPGNGLRCGEEAQLLGKKIRRPLQRGELITTDHCES